MIKVLTSAFFLYFTPVVLAMTPTQPKPNTIPTPTVTAAPVPRATPTPTPTQKAKALVTLGAVGPSVDAQKVQASLDLLNQVYANGCMERKLTNWSIPYLTTANSVKFNSKLAAWSRYIKDAPYALDIHWYQQNSTVMGYTYNWYLKADGYADKSRSETRVWTNRNIVTGPKTYAAHLAHELTHQIRAGGFVHYTEFDGTVPYEFGDIAYQCLAEIPEGGRSTFTTMSTRSVPSNENWLELKAKKYKH